MPAPPLTAASPSASSFKEEESESVYHSCADETGCEAHPTAQDMPTTNDDKYGREPKRRKLEDA